MRPRTLPLALGHAVLLAASGALAQTPAQTARAFVASPIALGMGDAAVAFPTAPTAFFYNPAHLAQSAGLRPRVTLGARAQGSTGIADQVAFFNDELQPAFDRGIENLSNAERQELYDEALSLTRTRQYAGGSVVLPTVTMRVGPVAAGAGLFSSTLARYRFTNGGGGVPNLDASFVADFTGVASGALDLSRFGVSGLYVGASAKLTKRYLTLKDKPLDAFAEGEQGYVLGATAAGLDLGALYELDVPIPGRLTLGAAVFDALSSGFDYEYTEQTLCDRLLCDEDGPADAAVVAGEEALANEHFALAPSYRIGVGYLAPSFFGLFGESGVALDYQGYADPLIEGQPLLARLHLGAQVRLAGMLALRAGLSQGYTSVGAGLGLGPLKLDYAYYGQEEARRPGDDGSWNHTVQLGLSF